MVKLLHHEAYPPGISVVMIIVFEKGFAALLNHLFYADYSSHFIRHVDSDDGPETRVDFSCK